MPNSTRLLCYLVSVCVLVLTFLEFKSPDRPKFLKITFFAFLFVAIMFDIFVDGYDLLPKGTTTKISNAISSLIESLFTRVPQEFMKIATAAFVVLSPLIFFILDKTLLVIDSLVLKYILKFIIIIMIVMLGLALIPVVVVCFLLGVFTLFVHPNEADFYQLLGVAIPFYIGFSITLGVNALHEKNKKKKIFDRRNIY